MRQIPAYQGNRVADLVESSLRVLMFGIAMYEEDVRNVAQVQDGLQAVGDSVPGWARQAAQVGRGDPDCQVSPGAEDFQMFAQRFVRRSVG